MVKHTSWHLWWSATKWYFGSLLVYGSAWLLSEISNQSQMEPQSWTSNGHWPWLCRWYSTSFWHCLPGTGATWSIRCCCLTSWPAYECQEAKTKCTVFNQQDDVTIKTSTVALLEMVWDFNYLRSWTQSSLKDLNTTKAWRACKKLTKIWKSNLPWPSKIKFFLAIVQSILLYCSETWTFTT